MVQHPRDCRNLQTFCNCNCEDPIKQGHTCGKSSCPGWTCGPKFAGKAQWFHPSTSEPDGGLTLQVHKVFNCLPNSKWYAQELQIIMLDEQGMVGCAYSFLSASFFCQLPLCHFFHECWALLRVDGVVQLVRSANFLETVRNSPEVLTLLNVVVSKCPSIL